MISYGSVSVAFFGFSMAESHFLKIKVKWIMHLQLDEALRGGELKGKFIGMGMMSCCLWALGCRSAFSIYGLAALLSMLSLGFIFYVMVIIYAFMCS